MSRAFTPPDTLSQDDIKTVADVRRAVWINGLFGLGAGSVTGMAGHLVLQTLQRRYVPEVVTTTAAKEQTAQQTTKVISTTTTNNKNTNSSLLYKLLKPLPPLTKNTFLLSFLAGGALGSFVLSSTAGKNIVHLLHPIFNVGREEYVGLSPYQIQARQAEEREDGVQTSTTTTASALEQDELDVQHHKQRSLHRKSSIKERLESGHSLSDTHSTNAHYSPPNEDDDDVESRASLHRAERWERRQTERRKWVKDRIESGGGLSDSHVTGGGSGR